MAAVGSLGMRTVFVVGVSGAAAAAAAASQQTQRRIEEEARAHRDIIQVGETPGPAAAFLGRLGKPSSLSAGKRFTLTADLHFPPGGLRGLLP